MYLWALGIKDNRKAEELARQGSFSPYCRPERALGMTKTTARGQIKEWIQNNQAENWSSISRLKQNYIKINSVVLTSQNNLKKTP